MAKVLQKLCYIFCAYSIPFSLSFSLSLLSPQGISITSVAFSLGQSRWTAALSSSIKFSSRRCPTSKEKEVCDPLLYLMSPIIKVHSAFTLIVQQKGKRVELFKTHRSNLSMHCNKNFAATWQTNVNVVWASLVTDAERILNPCWGTFCKHWFTFSSACNISSVLSHTAKVTWL